MVLTPFEGTSVAVFAISLRALRTPTLQVNVPPLDDDGVLPSTAGVKTICWEPRKAQMTAITHRRNRSGGVA